MEEAVVRQAHKEAAVPVAGLGERSGLERYVAEREGLECFFELIARKDEGVGEGSWLVELEDAVCTHRMRLRRLRGRLRRGRLNTRESARGSGERNRNCGKTLCELSSAELLHGDRYSLQETFTGRAALHAHRPVYFRSRQLGPKARSATSGTLSLTTPCISARTSSVISSASPAGTSKSNSSWTWSTMRVLSFRSASLRSMAIMASLMRSAPVPWSGVLMAVRSAKPRWLGLRLSMSGMG